MRDADVMTQRVVVGRVGVRIATLGTVVVDEVVGIVAALVQLDLHVVLAHVVAAELVVLAARQVLLQHVILARLLRQEAHVAVLARQAEVDAVRMRQMLLDVRPRRLLLGHLFRLDLLAEAAAERRADVFRDVTPLVILELLLARDDGVVAARAVVLGNVVRQLDGDLVGRQHAATRLELVLCLHHRVVVRVAVLVVLALRLLEASAAVGVQYFRHVTIDERHVFADDAVLFLALKIAAVLVGCLAVGFL